jgi:alpha-2-macroglobulin
MHAGGRVKPVAGGTLSLPGEAGGGKAQAGPVKVAFSSPQGEVGLVTELSVVFDRPVQPLGVVPNEVAPFRVSPEVPGSFRWVGSRAAVFTPLDRLRFATAYTVEVPQGLLAQDGTRLAETYRAELETRRPKVLASQPYQGQRGLKLDTKLWLELNQDVTPEALRAAAKLEISSNGARRVVPVTVTRAKEARSLVLSPERALPPHATLTLTVSDQLRGSEGPLPAAAPFQLSFSTYDPPAIEEVSCARARSEDDCSPEASVSLVFNNAVRPQDVFDKLRVTPDVRLERPYLDPREGEQLTSYVPLRGRFEAGKEYRIELDAGVRDEFGQRLAAKVTRTLRFADHYPRVAIGAVGRNFSGKDLAVPLASRNVPRFELLTAALSPADLLSWSALRAKRRGESDDLAWLSGLRQVAVQRVDQPGPKNQVQRTLVDTRKVLGGRAHGALAIALRYAHDASDYDVPEKLKVVSLSELCISAKLSRFGSLVWVTERATNAPVAGAEVTLLNPGRGERKYVTDADGLATIAAADFDPELSRETAASGAVLLARRGDDSAFAPVAEHIESWRLDVPSDFSGELVPYGVVFSDRGIYRPGDEVQVKGIVRLQTATGNALPPQQPLEVELRSSSGDAVAKHTALLTEHGTFSTKLALPAGAELGSYRVIAAGLGQQSVAEAGLEVAEYRPVELKVEASTDRGAYQRGDTAALELRASYLFGGAAGGLSASLSVSRQPTWFQVPGADGFTTDARAYFADIAEVSGGAELRRETRQLDEAGALEWTEKLELPGQRETELLRVDAEVTDVSRRSVATSSSALVHPAAHYVALRSEGESFVQAPATLKPAVLALTAAGQRLAGKAVALELVERRYTFAREVAGDDYRGVSKPVDTVVARCQLVTAAQAASCALAVPAAGYYLVVARSKDERGRQAQAAIGLYAAGPGEPTWGDNDRRSLELVLDKKSYAVGERARVLIKSPYKESEALITVERSGLYRSFRRTFHSTAASFEVPVTKELLPNAFIGVHLLPRRSAGGAKLEAGSYRIGYAPLMVSGEGKRLAVSLTPDKRDYRPGQRVAVSLSVRDARGAAAPGAEVTLYAVDEGVLSLVDYRTPDPLETFSSPRPLQVATLESRDAEGRLLLDALGSGSDKGRDGGGGGALDVRHDFRQTAYFNPRIVTDARGDAKVGFVLPESLTTFRLMAVAVGKDDRYGYAQERVTTSKPLMARPALPRFLRVGDTFEAGVVVSKKGLPAGKVRVSARFSGVAAAGPAEREVEVSANASVEVRFPAAAPRLGEGSVQFEVQAGAERDVTLVPLRVTLPLVPEVAAIYGKTTAAESQQLGSLSQARDDFGSLSVALSSTALVGVDQVALDLLEYPYACTEQLSSRLVPLVALGELGGALGFSAPADAKKRAQTAASEILQRQQGDGGFANWPESGRSWEFISPYATLALLRAQQAGVAVPKAALDRARDYLRRLADISGRHAVDLPTSALALDVLAELGAPDAGGVNRLFEARGQLPLFGKALLLHAAVGSKLGSDVVKELTRELEGALHLDGDRALVMDDGEGRFAELLDSGARTQALVLRALAATGRHTLLEQLARGLIGSRRQGRFRTTQEGAWALLALVDYRRVAEPEAPRFQALVSLGGERLGSASFEQPSARAERFELPLERLKRGGGAALVFEKSGSGQLFYEARLRYARKELPSQPLDAGFFVEKSLRAVTAESLARGAPGAPPGVARELLAGALVLVELTVVAPATRAHMVLDDPLPAGLEAIDPRLATTAAWLNVDGMEEPEGNAIYDRTEVRDDRVLFFAAELPPGLHHYRYLARATTLGRFVLPPTRVEEMYQPEVFGRTGASHLVVR